MRFVRVAAVVAACLFVPGLAQAEDKDACAAGMVCASAPATVKAALEKAQLAPKETTDNEGDPMLESDEAAYHFDVFFYGCADHKGCDSLRFETAFEKAPENTAELVNKWNKDKRFMQASVKDDGRLVVSYDVATIGGVNDRNFRDVLDWWTSQLNELGDFFKTELNLGEDGKPSKG